MPKYFKTVINEDAQILQNCKRDKIALIHARVASQTVHHLQLRKYSLKIIESGGLAAFLGGMEMIYSQLRDLRDPGFSDTMVMSMALLQHEKSAHAI